MTVPQGAKIIRNKYSAKCHAGDGMVAPDDGVAILDVNITGKWATFHRPCMPAPYELADVPVTVTIGSTHPYHHKGPVTPGHERCGTCSHWAQDHTVSRCTGSFRSAGGCTCTAFVGKTVPPTGLVPPTYGVHGIAAVAQATQPTGYAQAPSIPPDDTSFRLVVFFGNIKSSSDGEVHFVSANTVLDLHRITILERSRIPIEFVTSEAKQLYRPRSGDYVIGPRFMPSEYATASQSLAERLVKEGFRE